ncbi:dienelactone hydrolase family protein [Aspergillus sclerotioniger CBS 115572]|uniref:Dienelactone hydrolase family protein n=1 Tax=Aspergillus sclerotioniger CBS 115572 TaxID=1450535 RepID=A0A317X7F9_9EURO|nr:dienelactone hydrolase family protein [Aspergillus sclerotioniger CBS 115572]PWY93487.1 dienelactone hydrolase family protein [Aspergillus sclerotioniger CBS 115572]
MSCPDCFSGHVHDGTPKGEVTTLHGLDVYVTEPSGGAEAVKGIVIIIPDAFGWEFVNNRILADHYAEKGKYRVYLPDFMKGHAAPVWALYTLASVMKTGSLVDWVTKPYHVFWTAYAIVPFLYHNNFGRSWPVVKSFFTAVRQNEGAKLPIAAAGFCWGGLHTVYLAHGEEVDGKPLINAGFTGHPSNLAIPGDIEKIKIPVSFAMAELDNMVPLPQIKQIEGVLDKNGGVGEVKIYYGAGHGFCVRADVMVKNVGAQAGDAEDQAIEWFNRHFAGVTF